MNPPVVITLCDLGRVPPMRPEERGVWQQSHVSGEIALATLDPAATGLERVRAWPVHEPGWKREILRSDVAEW